VQSSPHNVGDAFQYVIDLVNNGGSSNRTTLNVTLPSQATYNGSIVDRGPGCTSAGQTLSCPLDFFPGDQHSTVIVGARVNSLGTLQMSTSVSSDPQELNTTDGSATITLTLGASVPSSLPAGTSVPTRTPAPAPPKSPPKLPPLALTLTTPIAPFVIHKGKHALSVRLSASKETPLTITLTDAKGHKLRLWREHARLGRNSFTLKVPPNLKPGKDYLEIVAPGVNRAVKTTVTIKR
jgi:hypothetical protein